jgi:sulfonate transport system permease protein
MKARDGASSLAGVAALLGLWWLASRSGWFSAAFLPSPEATAASLAEGLRGDLLGAALATAGHVLQGWAPAAAAGIALGAAITQAPALQPWLSSTLEFVRPLPVAALMPLALALYGVSLAAMLFVITFAAFWPALLATVQGVRAVEPGLLDVARCLRLSRLALLAKIALPSALPDILTGVRVGFGASLIACILGEMLTTRDGLGLSILLAARAYRASELFACLLLISLTGLAGHSLLVLAERRLLRHRRD